MKKENLKEKTYEELRKIASKKKIEGRSKMNKDKLIKAILKNKPKSGGGQGPSKGYIPVESEEVEEVVEEEERQQQRPPNRNFPQYSKLPPELRRSVANFLPVSNFVELKQVNKSIPKRNGKNFEFNFERINNIQDFNRLMDLSNTFNGKANILNLYISDNFTQNLLILESLYSKYNINTIEWNSTTNYKRIILPKSLKRLILLNYNIAITRFDLPQDLEYLELGHNYREGLIVPNSLKDLVIVSNHPDIAGIRRSKPRLQISLLTPLSTPSPPPLNNENNHRSYENY